MSCNCNCNCNCMMCKLKRFVRKVIKEEMIPGKDGIDGKDGEQGKQGEPGIDGKSGVPQVYHFIATNSALGNKVNVGKNIYYSTQKIKDTGLINVRLQGTQDLSGKTIADVNYTVNSGGTITSKSYENILLDNMYYTIASGINPNTMDLHKTVIRSRNANTGLWELFEVNLLASMGGDRIDVWVNEIYKEFDGQWK